MIPPFFADHPGRLYVVATLLPLLPAGLLLLVGTAKNLLRPHAADGWAGRVYRGLSRPTVDLAGAWLSVAALATAAGLTGYGLWPFVHAEMDFRYGPDTSLRNINLSETVDWIRAGPAPAHWPRMIDRDKPICISGGWDYTTHDAAALHLGYYIDPLAALMTAMVTLVGTLIFVFAIGYMREELREPVEDHDAHVHRRGRFGRFFLFLNLFVFAMLNLLVADNLFQLFVSWELVGACSYFLIGFYGERPAAGRAATKAFVVNRIGDAGFLIAMAVAWSAFGTLNIQDVILLGHSFGGIPVPAVARLALGLGLFLAAVGKSAQFPLHVWLPDAMAGPTPVSALIHAATMVTAGVYLLARCFPLFTPDVLLVVAYTGGVTMLLAAVAACVQTDIKKVLAYSTVSQLGLMTLGLVVGGPAAGVFHLLTHAYFKALLFLAAGSVLIGLHHEQDLRRMGGLRRRMPLTAYTMLVGVLAIAGFPLLSGWYSKEKILTEATVVAVSYPTHAALAVVPFVTAGLTAFYMARLWLLVFAGEPRDRDAFDHARESPPMMTAPLLLLAALSLGVGWGWPAWEPDASFLGSMLDAMPGGGTLTLVVEDCHLVGGSFGEVSEHHLVLEVAAGGVALLGFAVAFWRYGLRTPAFADRPGFAARGFGLDALYDFAVRRPTVALARLAARFDRRPDPAPADRPDPRTLDGLLTGVAGLTAAAGRGLRLAQTGRVRGYVLILGLTVAGMLGMLAALAR